jgi:hypothetical protein
MTWLDDILNLALSLDSCANDDYLAEIFQEFAEDNDAGALLVFLLVLALCSIKLSSDGADTGVTVCSGA